MNPRAVRSDAELVKACRGGDQAAWGELVTRFSSYVYAICVRAYRMPESDAEDVFQEVFARTYAGLDRLRDDDAIKAWIGQLARRLCVDRYRSARKFDGEGEFIEEQADPRLEGQLERLDEALTVRAALETLPPDCQDVLNRFFCRDESYQQISEALQIPSGTIASRISRCLARMRSVLTDVTGRSPAASTS